MGKGRIEVFNKNNKEHLKLLNKYLLDNKGKELENIFDEEKQNRNETNNYVFYIKDNEIKDIYYINVQKDLKICTIFIPTTDINSNKAISSITNYILNNSNMKQVFIKISKDNKKLKDYLLELGYEDLGEEDNYIIVLKEQMKKEPEITSNKR